MLFAQLILESNSHALEHLNPGNFGEQEQEHCY